MADPSYYQRFPVTQQLEHTEHIFHLYVEQRSNQLPNGNQIPIAPTKPPSEPAGHFGFGVSCDWDVRDGPTPTAKTVARAQGLLLGTGQLTPFHYFLCQNIIFTDERLIWLTTYFSICFFSSSHHLASIDYHIPFIIIILFVHVFHLFVYA